MFARPEKGQALVMGLVVLFFGTMTLFYLFNTGQVSADKQRLTNAADAAAYSAALWRARVLNYQAYANRAMIANEVAIAQSLTLTSKVQFHKNLAACLAQEEGDGDYTCEAELAIILQFVPYFDTVTEIVWQVLSYYDQFLRPFLAAEVAYRSTMNVTMSGVQELMALSTNVLFVQEIANQVARANDPDFSAVVLPDLFHGPNGFTRRYNDEDRNRIANVVLEGRDPYTIERNFTFNTSPIWCTGHELRRRGGTGLDSSLERWEAADTLSEWTFHIDIDWDGIECEENENPMGWGDRQGSGESDRIPSGVDQNPEAFDLARDSAVVAESYQGIQAFRDLNYDALDGDDAAVRNPIHKLGVVVRMDGSALRTSNTLNVGVGRLRMPENLRSNRLSSLAAAEVFFKRPVERSDGIEYPSLFNPYWQPRLAEPSALQRAQALAL